MIAWNSKRVPGETGKLSEDYAAITLQPKQTQIKIEKMGKPIR